MIDVKSLVIGILATALFFTVVGAKNRNDVNFDTITAKTIKIVHPEGKIVADLESDPKGEGMLDIFNKKGKLAAALWSYKGGMLGVFNKEGKSAALLTSYKGGGGLVIFNKHGKEVATVQSNKNSDGTINLFDRYGDPGWAMTGKR